MKKMFKTKVVSVLVTICLLFSTCGISANASAIAFGAGVGGAAKLAGGAIMSGWAAYELGQRVDDIGNSIYETGRNVYTAIAPEVYVWDGTRTITFTGTMARDFQKTKERYNVFPANPHDFNPVGFKKEFHPGTKNGAIITWTSTYDKKIIYYWDENLYGDNGPHYHLELWGVKMPHPVTGDKHYYAGNRMVP